MFGRSGLALTRTGFRKEIDSCISRHVFLVAVAVRAATGAVGKKLVSRLSFPYAGLKFFLQNWYIYAFNLMVSHTLKKGGAFTEIRAK